MPLKLKILLIAGTLIFIFYIFYMLKKEKIETKYTLVWIFVSIILLILAFSPGLIISIKDYIGIEVASNAVFLMGIFFTMAISFGLTVAISRHNSMIRKLTQENALLKKEIDDLKNKKKRKP